MASSLPEVGLSAVISGLPGFNAGAKAITAAYDQIEAKATNVTKATRILGSGFSSITAPIGALVGQFTSLGQGVLKFGALAGGAALVGVGALTAGVIALGGTALQETANYERMSLSIQNLVAREISQGQQVEQSRQVLAQLTAKETEELEKLKSGLDNEANSRDILAARIQEQQQKIIQLTSTYGDNGLVVIKERAELQGMQLDLQDLDGEISTHQARITELSSKSGQYVTVIDKVRTGQMSMTEAMQQATPRAQELLKWIQVLAIQSPFTQQGIADAFRTVLAYGFTTEAAQRLTVAMVDFTAATGKSEEAANLIALALGQVQARGKLSAQELRQLSEQGIGVNKILEDMGYSLDDVTNGLVPVDEFIEAVIKDMEIFKGAAAEQSQTLAGLTASLSDLKAIGLREFFTSTFSAIQPYVASFVDWLTKAALETGSIRKLGEALGSAVGDGLATIFGWITLIQNLGLGAGLSIFNQIFGSEGIALWVQVEGLIKNIATSIEGLSEGFTNLNSPLLDFSNIIPLITEGLTFINENFLAFQGALTGIATVLGVGVFVAIAAGILALLTPINLIIAGAALLGAAWANNWGGIQNIVTSVVTTVQGGWPAISAALSEWGTKFMDWVAGVYPQIPAKLTEIVNNIYNGLVAGWDIIAPALETWIPKFWDWANKTTANATTSLAGILTAIYTWATSPEAGSSLQKTGEQIGKMIADGISLLFQDAGTTGPILINLITGLGVGIAGIAGSLIVIGGQIVAGIAKGIANSFGADLQVWTFSDLQNYANWLVTGVDWAAVGSGILSLIGEGWDSMVSSLQEKVKIFNESIKQFFTDTWNSIYMTLLGNSLVWDVVNGIIDAFTGLPGKLASVFGVGGLIGALFGGGGGEEGSSLLGAFDLTTIIESFTNAKLAIDSITTAITNLATVTLPTLSAALLLVGPSWVTQFTTILQSVSTIDLTLQNLSLVTFPALIVALTTLAVGWNTQSLVMQQGVTNLDLVLQNLGLVTLPTLIVAATTLATGWVAQTLVMQQSTLALDTAIQTIASSSFPSLSTAAVAAGQGVVRGLQPIGAAVTNAQRILATLSVAFSQVKQIATVTAQSISDAFTKIDWAEIGRNIGEGIAEGLESKKGTIIDLAREVAKAALDAAKEELGISSPSQAFYGVALDTIEGMIIGWKDGKPVLERTITQTMLDLMMSTKYLVSMMSDEVWEDFMTGVSGFASFFTGEFSNQATELEEQIKNNEDIVSEMIDVLSKEFGKEISYEDILNLAMTRDLSNVDDPITQAITQAIDAQTELNNQTNDYLALQEKITKQQEEQKQLQFLQQQMKLLEFIQQYDLRPGEVLQGINLGANASVEDLANATSNVVQAIIDRLNTNLGTAQSAIGFQRGTSGFTVPPGYRNDSFNIGVTSGERVIVVPEGQSAPNTTSNQNINYYNFSMDVTTGSNAQDVVRQYQVMRSMVN